MTETLGEPSERLTWDEELWQKDRLDSKSPGFLTRHSLPEVKIVSGHCSSTDDISAKAYFTWDMDCRDYKSRTVPLAFAVENGWLQVSRSWEKPGVYYVVGILSEETDDPRPYHLRTQIRISARHLSE